MILTIQADNAPRSRLSGQGAPFLLHASLQALGILAEWAKTGVILVITANSSLLFFITLCLAYNLITFFNHHSSPEVTTCYLTMFTVEETG